MFYPLDEWTSLLLNQLPSNIYGAGISTHCLYILLSPFYSKVMSSIHTHASTRARAHTHTHTHDNSSLPLMRLIEIWFLSGRGGGTYL